MSTTTEARPAAMPVVCGGSSGLSARRVDRRQYEDAFERRCTQRHIEKAYHSPAISARTSATELHNGATGPLELRYSNCTQDTRYKAFLFLCPYSFTRASHSILVYHSIDFFFILKLFCRENNVCWVLPIERTS